MAVRGNLSVANSQQFNGLTVNAGASALQVFSGSGGTANVSLGAITRNVGGTVDFTLPASGGIATSTTYTAGTPGPLVDASGNYTAYATVNGGSYFATVSGGKIVAMTSYSQTNSFQGTGGYWTYQTLLTASVAPASGAANTGVVAFGAPNLTLTLSGQNDPADAGAILVTPSGSGATITGGSIRGGGGGKQLNLLDYGSLNLASAIYDNSGSTLTVAGPGTTTLSGNNTYTGSTFINGPGLTIFSGSNSSTAATYISGGTLQVGGGGVLGNGAYSGGITNNRRSF